MGLLSRLAQLDDRVLGRQQPARPSSSAWVAFALLAVVLFAVGASGLVTDSPAVYGFGLGGSVGALVQAVALFARRDRAT